MCILSFQATTRQGFSLLSPSYRCGHPSPEKSRSPVHSHPGRKQWKWDLNPGLRGPPSLPVCWTNTGHMTCPVPEPCLASHSTPSPRLRRRNRRFAASKHAHVRGWTDAYLGARLPARRAIAGDGGASTAMGRSSPSVREWPCAQTTLIKTGRQSSVLQKALRSL